MILGITPNSGLNYFLNSSFPIVDDNLLGLIAVALYSFNYLPHVLSV